MAAIVPRSKNLVMRRLRCSEEGKYSDWEEQRVSWQRKKMGDVEEGLAQRLPHSEDPREYSGLLPSGWGKPALFQRQHPTSSCISALNVRG